MTQKDRNALMMAIEMIEQAIEENNDPEVHLVGVGKSRPTRIYLVGNKIGPTAEHDCGEITIMEENNKVEFVNLILH